MKVKKVNQYSCDFCGKKKYSASAMKKHEKHCTMNPDRECRMCVLIKGVQGDLNELKGALVKPIIKSVNVDFPQEFGGNYNSDVIINEKEVEESVKKMIELSEGCSACALAAMRQLDIYCVEFDYNKMNESAMKLVKENIEYSYM